MTQTIHNKSGFTLIEVLLYTAMVGIILVFISTFALDIIDAKTKNDSSIEVQNNSITALDRIDRAARNAININTPTSGSSATLVLDNSPDLLNKTIFFIYLDRLYISEGSLLGTPEPLTSTRVIVSDLSFTITSPDPTNQSFDLSFTIKNRGDGQIRQSSINVNSAVQLRSKQ